MKQKFGITGTMWLYNVEGIFRCLRYTGRNVSKDHD